MAAKEERELDVVVLGASGFTGRLVLRELIAQAAKSPAEPLKFAVAGRNRARVKEALDEALHAAAAVGGARAAAVQVEVVEADVLEAESVASMCRRTRLVLNCVGPYRFYGRPVVAACVEARTDYIDISGEPEFIERMEYDFGDAAADANCLVVSGCGFDSVPADLGMQFALAALSKEVPAGAASASVTSYLTVSARKGFQGHYATWESLVHGLASADELRHLRKQMAAKSKPSKDAASSDSSSKSSSKSSRGGSSHRGTSRSQLPQWTPRMKAWVLPFPGADASIVRRTLAHAAARTTSISTTSSEAAAAAGAEAEATAESEYDSLLASEANKGSNSNGTEGASLLRLPASRFTAVKYSACFTLSSTLYAVLFVVYGYVIALLVKYAFGRKLLLKYPGFFSHGIFSHKGPSQTQLDATSFVMRFDAEASPSGARYTSVVCGPEPGYVATPWIMVQCALVMLRSRAAMPHGGVVTTAVAFAGTDLVQRLQKRGVTFASFKT